MTGLTERELDALSRLLRGEEMACKKTKIYSNTLTDVALAQEMEAVSRAHAARFAGLYAVLGGKGA